MKLVTLLIFLLVLTPAYAMTRDLPETTPPGEEITVALTVTDAHAGDRVVIGEQIPEESVFLNWVMDGVTGAFFEQDGNELVWEFTATRENPVITYKIRAPREGKHEFDGVYAVEPFTFGNTKSVVEIAASPPPQTPLVEEPTVLVEKPQKVEALTSVPIAAAVVLVLAVLCLGVGYVRVRVTQNEPKQSFVDQFGRFIHTALQYARMKLTIGLEKISFQRLTEKEQHVLETFEREKEHMLEKVEQAGDVFPPGEVGVHEELERMKDELKSIRIKFE